MPVAENKLTGPYCKETGVVRFWKRVEKSDSCWLWTGHVQRDYGAFWVRRKFYFAHRYSWELHFGDIPEGMCVCHKCDTPTCVRPEHLFLGSVLDNIKDRDQKSRTCKGEAHWCSKLTVDDVKEIRRLYQFGKRGSGATTIARQFGISKPVVLHIVNRRGWKHV